LEVNMAAKPPAEVALDQLGARVDAFFARVMAAHPGQMQCRRGCAMCCHPHLHLLPVEWGRVREAVLALPQEARARIARNAALEDPTGCALLDDDLSCVIFGARPSVCRSHGLPLRQGQDRVSCALNFNGTLESVPDADVLDEAQLAVTVGLIDRLSQGGVDVPPGPRDADGRVPIREALRALLAAK
jgi:Fe-S-cluster containining protein